MKQMQEQPIKTIPFDNLPYKTKTEAIEWFRNERLHTPEYDGMEDDDEVIADFLSDMGFEFSKQFTYNH